MKIKKVTIRDIAEQCGVSIATVSRAINGTAGVRPEIKAQIFQCMEDCGWRSNNLESRLSLPSSERSVVILTTRREPLSEYSITSRLIDRFREEGYLPLLLVGGTSMGLEFCLQSKPFAVIFYGNPSLFREQIAGLMAEQVRVVVIGSPLESEPPAPSFPVDDVALVRCATRRLLEAGHQRIAFFGEFGENAHVSRRHLLPERVRQSLEAIAEAVPGFDPVRDSVGESYGDTSALKQFLRQSRHTGWICGNLRLAKLFYFCALEQNLRIPRDLSVITFGQPLPEWDFPVRFTSVAADSGRTDSDILELLRRNPFPLSGRYPIGPVFIEGNSVAEAKHEK